MNYKELVNRADLYYNGTVERCEEGLPIGNGRMGTLIWTSPTAIKMQINRPDVFANGPDSKSSFTNDRDYAYGLGFIDVDFAEVKDDVFGKDTKQHLDVYNATAEIKSRGVSVEAFAVADRDVICLKITDEREDPDNIIIRVRTLRPTEVKIKDHVALSRFMKISGESCELRQVFAENEFYCASSLTVKAVGRQGKIRFNNENGGDHTVLNDRDFEELYDSTKYPKHFNPTLVELGAESETEMRICLPAEKGTFYLYIGSAATFDARRNIYWDAMLPTDEAVKIGYDALKSGHEKWWADFWPKSYIHLWGNENAEFIEKHYTYYLYILASCSRGTDFAPNFGGLIFSPRGDFRHWGNMQWWNNINLTYNAVLATGHNELMMPYLNMYHNAYDSWATAAEQQWGAKGIYIGETAHALGLEKLPDDIAEELRNFLLFRGPDNFTKCSRKFREFARSKNDMECRWNFLAGNRGSDDCTPVAFVTHLLSTTAFMAYQYYQYYCYTLDEKYLRETAYPMIKGAAEFYRTYPNTVKEKDGFYHIKHLSHGEGCWNCKDSLDTILAAHGITALTIKLAKKLGVDDDTIPVWQEFNDNLVPLPTNKDTDSPDNFTKDYPDRIWVAMHVGDDTIKESNRFECMFPCVQLEYVTAITKRFYPERFETALNSINFNLNDKDVASVCSWEMSGWPRILANVGNGKYLLDSMIYQLNCVCADKDHILFRQNGSRAPYTNRLTAREGINAISAQRLGCMAAGLQMGLIQCGGGSTENDSILYLFPAWDTKYNVEYSLFAKDGFKVTARMENGEIAPVEILSNNGSVCRIVAPFEKTVVDGADDLTEENGILTFSTEIGKTYKLHKA